MKSLLVITAVLMALFLMSVYRSTGRPIRTAAKSMGLGAASLVLVHLTTSLTGLTLG